jgi:trehalose 6-phosphate phosphatase
MMQELPDFTNAALFLDVDGTLVPIAANPAAVKPSPLLPALLRDAAGRLGGALALVSGREIDSIVQVTANAIPYLAGSHGAEYRLGPDQPILRPGPQPDLAGLIAEITQRTEEYPKVLIEPKRAGIAVHYRLAPHLSTHLREMLQELLAQGSRGDLSLLQGDHVLEIRSPAHNKGEAVTRLMAQKPFQGRRPVFIGDDVTDEDAFAVVIAMGGAAIIVGERTPTLAKSKLGGPDDVLALLARLGGAALTPPAAAPGA